MPVKIILVDDHVLLRKGLADLLKAKGYEIVFEASNGVELIDNLEMFPLPDIVLMDINMPQMNGYETTEWLAKNHPDIKVIALSMYDTESSIIRMIRCGARGYLLKDSSPNELLNAINKVLETGFYHSELFSSKLIKAIKHSRASAFDNNALNELNQKEIAFLRYCCTELSYKEIAAEMSLSPRTIDGYRDALFLKLDVRTRIGLAMYAVKSGLAG